MLSFRITAAAYALMLVLAYTAYLRPFGNEMDALSVLICMSILASVALWPRSAERNEARASMRKSWADRIDLGEGAGGGGERS